MASSRNSGVGVAGFDLVSSGSGLSERLRIVVDQVGTRKKASEIAGVSHDMIPNYVQGKTKVPFEVVVRLAAAAGVSLDWLANGEGPMERQKQSALDNSGGVPTDFLTNGEAGFVLIPRYDVVASAGTGSIVESDRLVDFLAFKVDWVRRILGIDPKRLAVISAEGDSMRPTISEGDVLLVDLEIHTIRDSGIYVLHWDGVLLVKRIRPRMDGRIDIVSDNQAYQIETIESRDLDRLSIAGRVVWHGGLV